MNAKQILLYCVVCLGATLAALAVTFRYAAVPPQVLTRARTPQSMESFPPINLGGSYGAVSMTDLVGYYLQHPPKAAPDAAAATTMRIGGC